MRFKTIILLVFCTPGFALGASNQDIPHRDDPVSADTEIEFLEFSTLRSDPSSTLSPFRIDLSVDLPIILTGFIASKTPSLMGLRIKQNMLNLDPGLLNPLDRSVLGNLSGDADLVSDVTMNGCLWLPFLLSLADAINTDSSDGLSGLLMDSVILLEVIAVNKITTTLSKFTFSRPRPYAYNESLSESRRGDRNASLSFFSGHTSLAFSMATAYSYLFAKRHEDSPLVIPVWIGMHVLAGTTAVMRVEAGKHFWSDVLVGAVMGSAVGFVVPYLHTRGENGIHMPENLMVLPMVFERGFGVVATLEF